MTKEEILNREYTTQSAGNTALLMRLFPEHNKEVVLAAMDEYAKQREEYWKQRCLAAEEFIEQTPCDPDITPAQVKAHEEWSQLVHNQSIEQQNKDNGV